MTGVQSSFHTDGYQVGLTWCSPAQAARITTALTGPGGLTVTRNPHLDPLPGREWARRAVSVAELVAFVRELVPDAAVENTFLIIKPPNVTFEVPPHQDGINQRLRLDPGRSVSLWLALTPATPASGCLQVVPGSHIAGYQPHCWGQPSGSAGRPYALADPPADEDFVPVPLAAGQAVAMDVRLIHRSHSNRTAHPRIGLNVRYAAPDAIALAVGDAPELYPIPIHRSLEEDR